MKTADEKQQEWDHHGSYQWTYFNESIKRRVNYFLSQRLNGRNLDLGGGWYLSYPDSVVVDISPVCLEYNPAREKLQFNLDDLSRGRKLPFEDGSFDSATIISTWQYLEHPEAVVDELRRVLFPGAEVYVINGQGAGVSGLTCNTSHSPKIAEFFKNKGFDTFIEDIPSFRGGLGTGIGTFKSVCAAMPDTNLFGDVVSEVRNKRKRIEKNDAICDDPYIFINAFVSQQVSKYIKKLAQLKQYPITKYSQEVREKIEEFSQEFNERTGKIPLVFSELGSELEYDMLLPDSRLYLIHLAILGGEIKDRDVGELYKKYGFNFGRYCNYFGDMNVTIDDVLEKCEKASDPVRNLFAISDTECEVKKRELSKFVRFLSTVGFNSFTTDLKEKVDGILRPKVKGWDEKLERQRAWNYFSTASEHKQRSDVDELIKLKRRIEKEIETVGEGSFELRSLVPYFYDFIIK